MRKRFSRMVTVICVALLVGIGVFLFSRGGLFAQGAPAPLTGYAWSSNIGWINFNGPNHRVTLDQGALRGYAWSSNIGWLSFERNDTGDPPSDDVSPGGPLALLNGNNVEGWARFLSACDAIPCANAGAGVNSGGWDGWVRLAGNFAGGAGFGTGGFVISPPGNYVADIARDSTSLYISGGGIGGGSGGARVEKRNTSDASFDNFFGFFSGTPGELTLTGWSPTGMALDAVNGYMYLVGWGGEAGGCNTAGWVIRKRYISHGLQVDAFDGDGHVFVGGPPHTPFGIAIDDANMYVFGYNQSGGPICSRTTRLEKRDLVTGGLLLGVDGAVLPTGSLGGAVAVHAMHVYTAGTDFRIEKRLKSTLALVAGFPVGVTPGYNATSIAIDPIAARMYVGGTNGSQWRIEKRLLTGALDPTFGPGGVGFVTSPVESHKVLDFALDAAGGFLYIAGTNGDGGGPNNDWRIEKRLLSNGDLVGAFGSGGSIVRGNAGVGDYAYTIEFDASAIYIAGSDNCPPCDWRIEKRNIVDGTLVAGGAGGAYGVSRDPVSPDDLTGFAWGNDVVGWISMNCNTTGVCGALSDYKVSFTGSGAALSVVLVANPQSGAASPSQPLRVTLTATVSDEDQNDDIEYRFDCANGQPDYVVTALGPNPDTSVSTPFGYCAYGQAGTYAAQVTVAQVVTVQTDVDVTSIQVRPPGPIEVRP